MNEETLEKPVKNRFQLELDAKMKERRARGLTTALSPSPTELNQGSRLISDDEDDILSSLQNNSFKPISSYKSKGNSPDFNKRMQWGDSPPWNPGLLRKDDKATDLLDITNKQSPSQKESPRSFENQKGYLKSTLKSPRNDAEIGSLQMVNSPRSFKDMPNKSALKDSPRDGYKPERKTLSFSDHVEESSYSTASVIDQSLSSVGDAPNKTPSTSSGQRFLKSSKKKGKSASIEEDEERNNQVKVDSVRPVPSVRRKSLTSPPNVTNKDPDSQNSELSSARSRRHAFKTNAPSSVFQDNLDESFGKTSPSSTPDMRKPESPKASKHKRNSVSEQEGITSTYMLENKPSVDVTIRGSEGVTNNQSENAKNRKSEDAINRKSKNATNRKSEDTTNRKSEDTTNRKSEDATNRKSEDTTNRKSKDTTNRKYEDTSNRTSEDITNGKSEDATNGKYKDATNRKSEDTTNRKSEDATNRKSEDTTNRKSKDTTNRKSEDTTNRKSDDATNRKSDDAMNRRSENVRNKQFKDVKHALQNNNHQESGEKGKSAFIERQSYSNQSTLNVRDKTFSIDKSSTQNISDDIKTPFSRRGSLWMENNKANENEDERDLNSVPRTMSQKSPSSVFDFLSKDFAEPKPAVRKEKSSENRKEFPPGAKDNKDRSLDKDVSSLFEEYLSESRPTPIPRKQKNQLTEGQTHGETNQVENCKKSQTILISSKPDKNTDSLNKTGRPKTTADSAAENVETFDPNQLREKIFKEWRSRKNQLIKEKKKQKIQEEEKKKAELVKQRKFAVSSFEIWKKQKVPLLRQKVKTEMTKKEAEIEKERENREKKQKANELYEYWKTQKDGFLKKEFMKRREEEERKQKLLEQDKEIKQEDNVKSFNEWKKNKDKVLRQKKKDELQTLRVIKEEQNYLNVQKESQSEESYQQWLWRKEEQEKEEFKKKRELRQLEESYMIEPQQAWLPPSRTVPFSR